MAPLGHREEEEGYSYALYPSRIYPAAVTEFRWVLAALHIGTDSGQGVSAGPCAEGKAQTRAADRAGAGIYAAKSSPGSGSWQDANLHPCAQITLACRSPRSTFTVLVIHSVALLAAVPIRTVLSCCTGTTASHEGKHDFPRGLLPVLLFLVLRFR